MVSSLENCAFGEYRLVKNRKPRVKVVGFFCQDLLNETISFSFLCIV